MKKLNLLRDKVHENAVKHGFWDGERSIAECLALIHSEVSEALEADRENRHAGDLDAEDGMLIEELGWKLWFESYIKDTFEDELADVVIRCLDLCGKHGTDLDGLMKYEEAKKKDGYTWFKGDNDTPSRLCAIHWLISNTYETTVMQRHNLHSDMCDIIGAVLELAKIEHIDIEKHIELKMKYNESREYKHGKEY